MSIDTSQITVGLDVGYESVRLVAIERTGQGPRILRAASQPLPQQYSPKNLFSNTEEISSAIRSLMEMHSEPDWSVIVGLRNRFASIMLPQVDKDMDAKTTFEWLKWEAEHIIDGSINEYIIDVGPTKYETAQGRSVFIVAAREEAVESLLKSAQGAGVNPSGMSVAIIALINAFEATHALTEWESTALVHIEPGAMDIVFIHGSNLNMAVMPVDPGRYDEEHVLQSFSTQFNHLLNVMPEEDAPDTIYISTDYKDVDDLCTHWGEQLNRRITPVQPFRGLQVDTDMEDKIHHLDEAAFMVATGLALHELV